MKPLEIGIITCVFLFVIILSVGFTDTAPSQDSCNHVLKQKLGVIMSPNFPNRYPANTKCTWRIEGNSKELIQIAFRHTDIEGDEKDCPDFVRVFDGLDKNSSKLVTTCGCPKKPVQRRSTSNKMSILFKSDSLINRPGFIAEFWTFECPPFKFGPETCNNSCTCDQKNSISCDNMNGTCLCKRGFTGLDCQKDVDECLADPSPCAWAAGITCHNTPGSYRCVCANGFFYSATGECLSRPSFTCEASADIIFVIDSSGSISSEEFKKQLSFAANFVGLMQMTAYDVRFGMVVYSTTVQKWFDLRDFYDIYDVQRAVLRAPHFAQYTSTHNALKVIREHRMFDTFAGGRSQAPDVVIVMTDGVSDDPTQTAFEAAFLKKQGVLMFSVGIADDTNIGELINLASNSHYVINVDDFSSLHRRMYPLMNQTCLALTEGKKK